MRPKPAVFPGVRQRTRWVHTSVACCEKGGYDHRQAGKRVQILAPCQWCAALIAVALPAAGRSWS